MHDIGKVGIPDRILLKPGKFDPEEWRIMKTHSLIGYEILKGDDSHLSEIAAIIALDHHEKWDGSGYPNSKKGANISIYGRISALSDVFDALTSKRPYKESWAFDEAFNYIRSQREIHFDPALTDMFFKNMDEIMKIRMNYTD